MGRDELILLRKIRGDGTKRLVKYVFPLYQRGLGAGYYRAIFAASNYRATAARSLLSFPFLAAAAAAAAFRTGMHKIADYAIADGAIAYPLARCNRV